MKTTLTKNQRNRIQKGRAGRDWIKNERQRKEIHEAFKRIDREERRNPDAGILSTHIHLFR